MKAKNLRMRILVPFDIIIATFSLSVAVSGYYIIEKNVMERAQVKIKNDLNSAREIYRESVEHVRDTVRFTAGRFFIKDAILEKTETALVHELDRIRKAESLDVLTLTDVSGKVIVRSRNPSASGDSQAGDRIVGRVLSNTEVIAGTAIVQSEELIKEGKDLAEQAHIEFIDTPRAKPRSESEETSGMMIKAAAPVLGYEGDFLGVLYGGTLLNRDYRIVDKVKETVYEDETYKGKDIGTATIFQGDLRISTNVQAKDGSRAVGTRVSAEVNEQLLVKGLPWVARAYVVNAWYKTAYEPIRDIDGNTIGILYVGVLEEPFSDMWRNVFLFFLGIVVAATALAAFLERLVTGPISRPVERMVGATKKLAEGDLGYTVDAETGTTELDALSASFNTMSRQLRERQDKLEATNDELTALNKTYLDLVGFVSHELKGIVATTMMNTLSVRDAIFGEVNPKQKWALDSAIKNLEYLRETVRKFLDLSRLEKGELELNKTLLRLREDVFEPCLEIFGAQIAERKIKVSNSIDADIQVRGDRDLLRIVANNLVGNAVKYGVDNGRVTVSCEDLGDGIRVEVYNDSRPISPEEAKKLFQKFSRLNPDEHKDVKGTGLGLFITKEIVEQHGGKIRVEPRENGNSFIFQIDKDTSA